MERRGFVGLVGAALVSRSVRVGHPTIRRSDHQTPLGPEVFARRLERLRNELVTCKLDLFVAAPGTNFQYFTGYNPGRSERMIALFVPARQDGVPVVVCPSFEVERLRRNTSLTDVRGWEE